MSIILQNEIMKLLSLKINYVRWIVLQYINIMIEEVELVVCYVLSRVMEKEKILIYMYL